MVNSTKKLFDNYIRQGKYSDLNDVQSRIDYYVARQIITAEEGVEYAKIASERVVLPEVTPEQNAARIEYLEAAVLDMGEMFALLMGGIAE